MSYGTLPSRFLKAIDSLPNPRAQLTRRSNVWEPISSAEFLRRVAGLSMALLELCVKPGDRVALFATNRPEWHTADLAIHGAGAVDIAGTIAVSERESRSPGGERGCLELLDLDSRAIETHVLWQSPQATSSARPVKPELAAWRAVTVAQMILIGRRLLG